MTYHRIIDNMDVGGEELQRLIGMLPSWRREQALRYKHESGRRECTMSYLLLCDMLREHFHITEQPVFAIGEHGKPQLSFSSQQGKMHFNLSHCKRAIACIVSDDSEVGIDVECLGRYKESLAEYCMSQKELQAISDAPVKDEEFTRLWTQKEALLKYTGEGIVDDMKTVLGSSRVLDTDIETMVFPEKGYALSMVKKRTHSDHDAIRP